MGVIYHPPVAGERGRNTVASLRVNGVGLLKHETSTLRQSHNCISIDFIFGVSINVKEVNYQPCQIWF